MRLHYFVDDTKHGYLLTADIGGGRLWDVRRKWLFTKRMLRRYPLAWLQP